MDTHLDSCARETIHQDPTVCGLAAVGQQSLKQDVPHEHVWDHLPLFNDRTGLRVRYLQVRPQVYDHFDMLVMCAYVRMSPYAVRISALFHNYEHNVNCEQCTVYITHRSLCAKITLHCAPPYLLYPHQGKQSAINPEPYPQGTLLTTPRIELQERWGKGKGGLLQSAPGSTMQIRGSNQQLH
eukprot:1158683-Pelagomonas_calceolata.AAC.3